MLKCTVLLVASILALPGPDSLIAQEQDTGRAAPAVGPTGDSVQADAADDTVQTGMDRARAILVELNASIDSIIAVYDRLRVADEEERRLARVQAWRYVETMQGLQTEMLSLIPTLETAGLPADSITRAFGSYLSREAQLYDEAIEYRSQDIAELGALRASTPPEELSDLEVRISASKAVLDSILTSKIVTLSDVDSIGLDMSEEWEFLDRFLVDWAEGQAGRLQIAIVDRNRLRDQIHDAERAGTPESEITALRTRRQAAVQRIDGIVKSLTATANLLAQRGFETNQYRQVIIQATGQVTVDILDPQVLFGLVRDAASDIWTWIKDNGANALVQLFIVVLSVILFRVGFRLAWWVFRLVGRVDLPKLATDLVGRTIRPFATIFGLFAGLWFIGVNPTALVTGLGVAGIIVGLALQDSLSNLAAGFFILVTRPYDMGDVVKVGGVLGNVKAMGLANTTIVTFDAERLFVPNRKIWNEVIANRSAEEKRRVQITARVSYEEDVDQALDVIRDLLHKNETVLDEPQPSIFVSDLADSWVEIAVRPWVRNADWWPFTTELRRLIRLRFEQEGIEIPFPTWEIVGPVEPADDGHGSSSDSAAPAPDSASQPKGDAV